MRTAAPRNNVADYVVCRIDELAKKKGVSMAQISLAWMLTKPGVSAPIIGTTSLANLEDILGESPSFSWCLPKSDRLLMLACSQAASM